MHSKTTLQLMLGLVLISCVILISFKLKTAGSSINKMENRKVETTTGIAAFSDRIDPNDAVDLRKDYIKYSPLNTVNENGAPVSLLYFSFKLDDIKNILNNINKRYDRIALKFGLDPDLKRWRLIAYGMKGSKLLRSPIYFNSDYTVSSTSTTYDVADASYKLYKQHKKLRTYDEISDLPGDMIGFVFDAWQIDEIVNNNTSAVTPDKVGFYLGLQRVQGEDAYRWHLIAYGMKNGELLNDVKGKAGPSRFPSRMPRVLTRVPSVFDKADPCRPCN
jgi:hypothetical protein